MSATHHSIVLQPMVKDGSLRASLNEDARVHILRSNAEFHPAHPVGSWGDSLSEFLECIEAGGHVCGVADVGTFLGVVPLQVAEGGVFFLGSSHEVSEGLKDVSVWVGCSFLVWDRKREADAQGSQCVGNNVFSCVFRFSVLSLF